MKRSLAPAEYAFAVSMKLMPFSSAACTMAIESCSVVLRPNIIVPRHSGLTLTPVRPRLQYSMGVRAGVPALALFVAEEVALTDGHAVVPQDRVGRRVVEVEVRDDEVQQVVLAREVERRI